MRTARRLALLALLAVLVAIGCGPVAPTVAPATLAPESPAASPSITAAPTSGRAEIPELVDSMEAAVLAADRASYLALVDLSDPVFEQEHTRWADEWSGPSPVSQYSLQLGDEILISDELATAQLTVKWALQGETQARTATYQVQFTRDADGWRYAGESWIARPVPHFVIKVAPGLEDEVPEIAADLPAIYDGVTAELGYTPAGSMEIKLYADAEGLVANTLLSLPTILGWNEPGEALKLRIDPKLPSLAPIIAHEFSHFLGFDRAGTQRSRMPWWLDEGVATYVSEAFDPRSGADRLAQVIAWNQAGELADWDAMAVFEEAPRDLWQFAYPQGYAMVRYVTEEYGDEKRNAWLAAMATEMDIDQATPAVLGLAFDELDADFRGWLSAQP